jgi:diguanylate cyclase (GGDEF)-like protein
VGGDEFVVLLPKVDGRAGVDQTAERLSAALEQPFHLGPATARIAGSVGRAVSPDDGADHGALLRRADASMYSIKRQRRATSGARRTASAAAAAVPRSPS